MVAFLSIALMKRMSTPGTQPCDPSSAFLPCTRGCKSVSFQRRSLTWDRGLEKAKHKDFTLAMNVQVYFSSST